MVTRVGEDVQELDSSYAGGRMQDVTTTLANRLAVSQMVKHRVTM